MKELLQALSSGLTKFITAWITPSLLTVALFSVYVAPELEETWPFVPLAKAIGDDEVRVAFAVGLATLALSLLSALGSHPLYRLLEGYTLPRAIRRPLYRRARRRWARLRILVHSPHLPSAARLKALEEWSYYPESEDQLQATRLGNALRALETYGTSRFGLDSQLLWYELNSVASPTLVTDLQDARSAVDFFISLLLHLALLGSTSLVVGLGADSKEPVALALASFLALPLCYRQAVVNTLDWRATVQALVNCGRPELADKLGLRLPATISDEFAMWRTFGHLVQLGPQDPGLSRPELRKLDDHRASASCPECTS